jgi:SAM-dependent methyltransferase
MSLSDYYKRQFAWRDWSAILDALPSFQGHTVLDLGCGVGDVAAELVGRGARVIGVDGNEELLREARSKQLANAEFRLGDLRDLPDLGCTVQGIWSSFAAAYFPDLAAVLHSWTGHLAQGGWMALTEIDDLFGHEPLLPETKAALEAFADDALAAGRYDFHMGHKLQDHMSRCGCAVSRVLTPRDQELSFDGPASRSVLDSWRARWDRMRLLHDFCGSRYDAIRDDFFGCLVREDHRSVAKVYCCIGSLHE